MNQQIKTACDVMRRGGIILYPTDTVWGIGCDATNSDAVRKIFDIKHRADSKAMITLVSGLPMLERYVRCIPDIAYELMEVSVKPITIVYDSATGLAPELLAQDGSIGIRVTSEEFSNRLCRTYGRPIVSTSANVSGQKTPCNFSAISDEIITAVDFVVDYARDVVDCPSPSSVIKISENGTFHILRP